MRNVIISGATSFLAVSLINRLLRAGCMIYAIVRPNSINLNRIPLNENIRIIELNISEIQKLGEFALPNIDAIYHFAWEGVRGEARNNNELQERNYKNTKRCIDECIKLKIPYFIGIGSQAEYGITDQIITEETALEPICAYGRNKVKSYNYGMDMYRKEKFSFVWARIFSAYGPNENPNTLLMECITKMKRNETINLSPCEHMWDYTYCDDVAEALFLLLERKVKSGAYNISYGQARRLKEYILQLKSIMQSKSFLNFGAFSYDKRQNVQMNPDVSKLKNETGWAPIYDFETGIKKMIEG